MSRLVVLTLSLAFAHQAAAETIRVLALRSTSFFYEEDGRSTGIEHDILEYFARSRDASLEVEYVDSFASILDRIAAGEADVGAGTITITPERMGRVDFSASYFPVQVTMVKRRGDSIPSLDALAGEKVGAFAKTTAEDALKAVPGIQIATGGDLDGMMQAVEKGEMRAAVADSSAIIPVIEDYPSLEIAMTLGEQQGFGFAFPKGSPLKTPVSDLIQKLKQSGIYFRVVTTHMGPRASEIVRGSKD